MQLRSTWICALAALICTTAAANDVTPESYEAYRAAIKPHKGECRWANIAWVTDPVEAVRRAAEEGKPILMCGGADGSCVNGAQ